MAVRDWIPPAFSRYSRTKQVDAPGSVQESSLEEKVIERPTLEQCFIVLEVDDAEPVAGSVFRRRFKTDSFPENPRHYVAFAVMEDGSLLSIGYVHYTIWEGCALCGGLVVDDRHYRKLPKPLRHTLQDAGGIAELLLRQSFERLPKGTIAIWGHVGDKLSQKVCLRVGFEKTDKQFLLVVWKKEDLTQDEKETWIDRAFAITPF